jgi:hypothetical protein
MTLCGKCNKSVAAGEVVQCEKCDQVYHQLTCGASSTAAGGPFVCEECLFQASSKTVRSPTNVNTSDQFTQILNKLSKLDKMGDDIANLSTYVQRIEKQLGERVGKIEAYIASSETRETQQDAEIKRLTEENHRTREHVQYLSQQLNYLSLKQRDTDQYSRSKHAIIVGLPQSKNENLCSLMRTMCEVMGCEHVEVLSAHRLSHQRLGSNVIAVFRSKEHRNDVLMARKEYGKTLQASTIIAEEVFTSEKFQDGNISVFEQLSDENLDLYLRARANSRQLGYGRCYTANGRVLLQEGRGCPKWNVYSHFILEEMIRKSGVKDVYNRPQYLADRLSKNRQPKVPPMGQFRPTQRGSNGQAGNGASTSETALGS